MLLKGSFIPQFHVCSTRFDRGVSRRNARNPVLCISKKSSSFGETPVSHSCESMEVHCKDSTEIDGKSVKIGSGFPRNPELTFDKLQVTDRELYKGQKRAFGRFVAREALHDEEYWTAAWLRAEAQYESVSYMRHIDSFKGQYAEKEFNALKLRCTRRDGNSLKCICVIAVKKEDPKIKRTVLNSVVGTLDLSVRQFLPRETFPGERRSSTGVFVSRENCEEPTYAYIANVCVSKFARRQGIASNMLSFATDVAVSSGMKQLFVHVNVDNQPAQDLYKKAEFEVMEAASPPLAKDRLLLMRLML